MVKHKESAQPKGLSADAKRWWKRLTHEYDISDDGGRLLLEQALRSFDRAEAARKLLDKDGVVVLDRWGQQKPHPAAAVERDSRAGMLAALRQLNLDVEPIKGIGRPGGS